MPYIQTIPNKKKTFASIKSNEKKWNKWCYKTKENSNYMLCAIFTFPHFMGKQVMHTLRVEQIISNK